MTDLRGQKQVRKQVLFALAEIKIFVTNLGDLLTWLSAPKNVPGLPETGVSAQSGSFFRRPSPGTDAGLQTPTSGTITLDGKWLPAGGDALRAYRNRVAAFIPQDARLIDRHPVGRRERGPAAAAGSCRRSS